MFICTLVFWYFDWFITRFITWFRGRGIVVIMVMGVFYFFFSFRGFITGSGSAI